MTISINTPALLFPAISLIMLAYTNRFLALAAVVRNLHDRTKTGEPNPVLHAQIKSLRYRLKLIKAMQFMGVLSFLLALVSMYFINANNETPANITFAISVVLFAGSLFISLLEIQVSTKALELELSDMEGLDDKGIFGYLKDSLKKK
ncbi:II family cellulose-binding protein [Sphingobacteriaceae bacterium]|nr:II family cellulose-binding protein [Sphingobacteriaceae bacterium]